MKTTNYRGRFWLASILPIFTLSAFVTATAAKSPVAAQGEELAVWNAMAGVVGLRVNHNLDVHVAGFVVHKL